MKILLIACFIYIIFIIALKLFQKFCLWLVWDCKKEFKFVQKYAHIIFGIGIGRLPRKVKKQ